MYPAAPAARAQGGHCACAAATTSCAQNNFCGSTYDDLNCTACNTACAPGELCAANRCVPPAQLTVARTDLAVAAAGSSNVDLAAIGGPRRHRPARQVEYLNSEGNFVSDREPICRSRATEPPPRRTTRAICSSLAVSYRLPDGARIEAERRGADYTPASLATSWSSLPHPGLALAVTGAAALSPSGRSFPFLFGGTTADDVTDDHAGLGRRPSVHVDHEHVPAPESALGRDGGSPTASTAASTILVGGVDDAGTASAELVALGWSSATWSQMPLAPWPNPRVGASAATDYNGLIYVAGGVLPDGTYSSSFDIYNPYFSARGRPARRSRPRAAGWHVHSSGRSIGSTARADTTGSTSRPSTRSSSAWGPGRIESLLPPHTRTIQHGS